MIEAEEKRAIALEKKIQKEYKQAQKDIQAKYEKFNEKYEKDLIKKRAEFESGKITAKQLNDWKKARILRSKEYEVMLNDISDILTRTSDISMKWTRNEAVSLFVEASNYAKYEICKKTDLAIDFTIYDERAVETMLKDDPDLLPQPKTKISKEKRWNKNRFNSEITQGIIQGKSIPQVAKGIAAITGSSMNAATRNARTALMGAHSAGQFKAYKEAQELGIIIKKRWIATLDGRTRHSHRELDGESVELNEEFSNGLMYPRDPNGEPSEVYNCRCEMEGELDGFSIDIEEARWEDLDGMTYEEWKKHGR